MPKNKQNEIETRRLVTQAIVEDNRVRVCITREVTPEENEERNENAASIRVAGMEWRNDEAGVPFIDAHDSYGSITEVLLGRVTNLEKGTYEGKPAVLGEIQFADTPNGRIAKELYLSGIARDVSVGIQVVAWDDETQFIEKSKLFEVSGVVIGANEYASVMQSAGIELDVETMVKNFAENKPKLKQFRKLFMSDAMFEAFDVTKTGNELADMKLLEQAILSSAKKEETEQAKVNPEPEQKPAENLQQYATVEDLKALLDETVYLL